MRPGIFLFVILLLNEDVYVRFPLNFLTDFLNPQEKHHKIKSCCVDFTMKT